jgi:hypothetical protein
MLNRICKNVSCSHRIYETNECNNEGPYDVHNCPSHIGLKIREIEDL